MIITIRRCVANGLALWLETVDAGTNAFGGALATTTRLLHGFPAGHSPTPSA